MERKISIACTEREIINCYTVMAELRPNLLESTFVALVKHLNKINNFQLAYLYDGEIKAVAELRISEWLANGKYLEIEDLVTKNGSRAKGYGGELFDWLVKYAKENNCNHLRLVSNVIRKDAHRFYIKKEMKLEAYYFSINLK